MPRKKKTEAKPFGVNQCSVCAKFLLTFGQQHQGGVRYCEDCIKHTLLWHQMPKDRRENMTGLYAALRQSDQVRAAMIAVEAVITPEMERAHSIGEATRRAVMAEMEG